MKNLSIILITFILTNCAIFSSLDSISNVSNSVSKSLNSISTSLESISNSLRSSSESISDSSGGKEKKEQQAYTNDVQYLTIFAIKESLSKEDYLREIGRIARKYGIYNWKVYPSTYRGMGQGLRNANIKEQAFNEFLSNIPNEEIKKYLIEGYYN
jgi:hypothetical protein